MLRAACLCTACWGTLAAWAQTAPVAYKSHSGDPARFAQDWQAGWMETRLHETGLPPARTIKIVVDTVFRLSDREAVLVLTEYCKRFEEEPGRCHHWYDTLRSPEDLPTAKAVRKALEAAPQGYKDLHKTVFIGYRRPKGGKANTQTAPLDLGWWGYGGLSIALALGIGWAYERHRA